MTASATPRRVPAVVSRALLRAVQTIRSAPAEIRDVSHRPDAERDGALAQVSGWLYGAWYCTLEAADAPWPACLGREDLSGAFRASTAASTRWESDWVAVRTDVHGVCVAGRGTATRELRAGDYANLTRPGLPVAPGDRVAARALVEWTDPATGFWCARSGEPGTPFVRVYFSAAPDGVGYTIAAMTAALDSADIPYSFKCPSLAAAFARVDSLVLYLDADAWSAAAAMIEPLARRTRPFLRDATPPLTKKLARGVAYAEDPGNRQSFGEHRCAALAHGALRLLQEEQVSTAHAVAVLTGSLEAAGIDPACPWLKAVNHA